MDAYSVVVAFLAALEALLGAAAIALGLRLARTPPGPEADRRQALPALAGAALVGIAVVSFPLFYLMLESWVPRWPGIMCLEGVRRIGTGTVGASRWLPALAAALDGTKLAVLFVAGLWLVLRKVAGGPTRGVAWAGVLLGLVAVLDGAGAFAYTVIPKEEIFPAAGCCSAGGMRLDRVLAPIPAWLAPTVLGGSVVLGLAALALRWRWSTAGVAALAAAGGALLPVAGRYLSDVLGPRVLGLPYHRCAWCALEVPGTIGVCLGFVGGIFGAGWALAARGTPLARRLLLVGAVGFLVAPLLAFLPIDRGFRRVPGASTCAMDGQDVQATAKVVVEELHAYRFCSVDCARRWLAASREKPRSVRVTDETTGKPVNADQAWFVESLVPVPGAPSCRVHSFAAEADARRHARDYRGVVLEGGARPFPGRAEGNR